MYEFLEQLGSSILSTMYDVLPILVIIFVFQIFVIRRPIANLRRVLGGFIYVLIGMSLFIVGLEEALFPIGKLMAAQLTNPEFILGHKLNPGDSLSWTHYVWVYAFAAALGFSTTVAEPALIAVSLKAAEVSGGTIQPWGLRGAVALGVAIGIALGTFRIVTGTPLHYYIIAGYVVVLLQTMLAPKSIIALAYDSGGVTTSTVTVPLVTALGLGLAGSVPGRSTLLDGFGLIAFASLFPIMAVMGYAQISHWRVTRELSKRNKEE